LSLIIREDKPGIHEPLSVKAGKLPLRFTVLEQERTLDMEGDSEILLSLLNRI